MDPSPSTTNASGGDPTHQLTVLALAGALWSWWPAPSFAALIVAYLAALLLLNSSFVLFGPALTLDRLPRRWAVAVALLASSAPACMLLRESPRLVWHEELVTLQENLPHRIALESSPAIFPAVLRSDQPQRFHVHADSETLHVDWDGLRNPLPCVSLGHGLFQFSYQPALHGAIDGVDGFVDIRLRLDRRTVTRRMRWIRPQPHPRWFSSNPEFGRAAAVSEETDQLAIVFRDGAHQVLDVGDGPTDCVWIGESRLVVCHRHGGRLTVIDLAGSRQTTVPALTGRWTRLAVSPDGQVLAAGRGGARPQVVFLSVEELLDGAAEPSPAVVDLPDEPDWICFGRNSSLLIVSCRRSKSVHRIIGGRADQLDEAVASEALPRGGVSPYEPWTFDPQPLQFPRPISAMGRTSAGRDICLATTSDALGASDLQGNHLVVHTIHVLDSFNWRIRDTFRTDRRSERQDLPGNSDRGGSPLGFCAVDDERMLVAMAGTNEVWRLSANNEPLDMFDLSSPGMSAPHGVGNLGQGRWCVSSPADAAIEVHEDDGRLVARVVLASDGQTEDDVWRRRGERTFYETTRSGVSCQSCHLHSDSDYARHNIGQGHLSSTLSTLGVSGTAPFLRDASNSRLRDLHDLASGHYRGFRREVAWDRARALASYLNDLPAAAPPESPDLDGVRRGVTAFVRADCVRCHAFPALTNLGVHFASFLFPEEAAAWRREAPRPHLLDTPSLHGLARSAPYLHDGRAQTIWQVLRDHNLSNRHGNVQALTREELEDLTVFLKSL